MGYCAAALLANGLPVNFQTPDFTEAERRVVVSALRERYKSDLPLDAVDVEMKLDPESQ